MIFEKLYAIEELVKAGDHDSAHSVAVDLASAYPDDARAQLAAAFTSDRLGLETTAIFYYRRASNIGVPDEERPKFLLSFASTLRNAGEIQEAIDYLTQATYEHPNRAEFYAFLALAYHSSGQHARALATMLEAALMAARPDGFGTYTRALNEYKGELFNLAIDTSKQANE